MEKYGGSDYDREAFVHDAERQPRPSIRWGVGFLVVATVAAVLVAGYIVLTESAKTPAEDSSALLQIQGRLTQIEGRLERLEQEQKRIVGAVGSASSGQKVMAAERSQNEGSNLPRVIYKVSPPTVDENELRRGLGAVQNQAAADRGTLEATSGRLAQVAGQVEAQQGQILRSQSELDQLLARAEQVTFSFELRRGHGLQPVGPLYLSLKDSSLKRQRYTLCVYVQESCIELRDRSPYELVQLGRSPNAAPFEVIVTLVDKDQVKGYLEVPREGIAHSDLP